MYVGRASQDLLCCLGNHRYRWLSVGHVIFLFC